MADLFYRSGTPFEGTAQVDSKGRASVTRVRKCSRCGGAGGSSRWAHTGWTCFDCGGNGTRGTETVSLYTADKLAKLNATRDKRLAKKEAAAQAAREAAQAEADARRASFVAEHGALIAKATPFAARNEFIRDVLRKANERADLTPGQADALAAAVARIEANDAKRAASAHVGKVGERCEFTLTVERVNVFDSQFGLFYISSMRDQDGNAIVSKGRFVPSAAHWNRDLDKWELDPTPFKVRATIKGHDCYRDERQTIIERAREV